MQKFSKTKLSTQLFFFRQGGSPDKRHRLPWSRGFQRGGFNGNQVVRWLRHTGGRGRRCMPPGLFVCFYCC